MFLAAAAALLDGRADEPVHVAVDRASARATARASSTSCCSTTAAPTVLADTVGRQALNCIRCSACLNICPVYERTGGHAYGSVYPGPIGAILTPMLVGVREARRCPTRRASAAPATRSARSRSTSPRCSCTCAIASRRNRPPAFGRRLTPSGWRCAGSRACSPAAARTRRRNVSRAGARARSCPAACCATVRGRWARGPARATCPRSRRRAFATGGAASAHREADATASAADRPRRRSRADPRPDPRGARRRAGGRAARRCPGRPLLPALRRPPAGGVGGAVRGAGRRLPRAGATDTHRPAGADGRRDGRRAWAVAGGGGARDPGRVAPGRPASRRRRWPRRRRARRDRRGDHRLRGRDRRDRHDRARRRPRSAAAAR